MRKRQKIVSTSVTTQEYNLEGELTKEFNGFPEEFPEELKKLR